MNLILLDTHIWIWLALADNKLTSSSRKLIHKTIVESSVFLSAISLWETAMLVAKDRIEIEKPLSTWLEETIYQTKVKIMPITCQIAAESCQLPGNCHKDPADRLIIATARIEGMSLLTKDKNIIHYSKQNHLKTIST